MKAQTRSGNLPNHILYLSQLPFRHGCSSRGNHRVPSPEGPQGPDEEGSRGCPDPAVGSSSASGCWLGIFCGDLESHCQPFPLGSSPYPSCGWCTGCALLNSRDAIHIDTAMTPGECHGGLGPVPAPGLYTRSKLP